MGKLLAGAFLGVTAMVVCAALLAYLVAWSGIANERLRQEAESAIRSFADPAANVSIGAVRLSLDGGGLVSLHIKDAELDAAGSGGTGLRFGSVRFGLEVLPLLRGEMVLGAARIGDVRIDLSSVQSPQGEQFPAPWLDERGLVDPDASMSVLFAGVNRLLDALGRNTAGVIELRNVEFVLGTPDRPTVILLVDGRIDGASGNEVKLAADFEWRDRPIQLSGTASRNPTNGLIDDVELVLAAPAVVNEAAGSQAAGLSSGEARATIRGSQRRGRADEIVIDTTIRNALVEVQQGDRLPFAFDLTATAIMGTGKLEIDKANVRSGRSRWSFNGAVGPQPAGDDASGLAAYRFELVSDGSVLSPLDSPEPAMPAVARVAGRFEIGANHLLVEQIGLRTGNGEIAGSASIRFAEGVVPGIDLSLKVFDMPVGQVKQVWPWFAARGARNWVVNNIYGGHVPSGRIDLSVPAGRLGNGVPLNDEEVSGNFVVRGTRFDIAGNIPPVRDGDGRVAFRGSDVDIALESGTVFMPSGRTVAASGGTLEIRNAHVQPVTGNLRIDVAGDASEIMELAGYDPINANRFIDITPEELSGDVRGEVRAQIPLQANIPVESLDWRVALDYQDLAVARPFEGQLFTEAKGTIVVDPRQALIQADARLNGAPGTVRLLEPLGESEAERERSIALVLDDKARNALAPGLSVLLSGPAEVEFDQGEFGNRTVRADLRRSDLRVPWIGWSKGAGIPGLASFAMSGTGDKMELSDFRLSGESFEVSGALSLSGGEVIRARFPSARLNRSDSFSFDMRRQGRGYAITIRGESIDARSVIKLFTSDAESAAKSVEGVPISVDLEVGSMTGFHGEVLRNVALAYSGTGSTVDSLDFRATSRTGRPISFTEDTANGVRSVAMRSSDAGAVLRFLDIYERMDGGDITLALRATGEGPLRGQVDARDFWIVNEPRLGSIVATPPPGDRQSLNEAVRAEIDGSRVQFERGFTRIEKGKGYLALEEGILRGPLIGASFQGMLYDAAGSMNMTGTFMPAYGLNRLFGEIPIIGQILGNGRDRGLIGITFRLAGKAGEPELQINPLSAVAPGIFRSVFEFR